jgi:hypothetical protein
MGIRDFDGTSPEFKPEAYFIGSLRGWGVIESPIGGLQKRLWIVAEGTWDVDRQTVTLVETYHFDDGHTDTLRWSITKVGEERYQGSEPCVEGVATGEQAGCAFHWQYTRNTPQPDGSSTKLNFDDWFYLIADDVCVVRGTAGRAGLPFAVAHVTYQRQLGQHNDRPHVAGGR